MNVVTLVLSLWGSVLATMLALAAWKEKRRLRERRVELVAHLVHQPVSDGGIARVLHLEATNLSEHPVSIKRWNLVGPDGTVLITGSPYEGRIEGPDLLQPRQLHGWTIGADILELLDRQRLVKAVAVLTSNEEFSTGLLDLLGTG